MRVLVFTAFVAVVGWPVFGVKGLVLFVPFWAIFETVYRLKVRGLLACPHCGFNPYLLLSNEERAKTEVREFWKKKLEAKGIPLPESHQQKVDAPSKSSVLS